MPSSSGRYEYYESKRALRELNRALYYGGQHWIFSPQSGQTACRIGAYQTTPPQFVKQLRAASPSFEITARLTSLPSKIFQKSTRHIAKETQRQFFATPSIGLEIFLRFFSPLKNNPSLLFFVFKRRLPVITS